MFHGLGVSKFKCQNKYMVLYGDAATATNKLNLTTVVRICVKICHFNAKLSRLINHILHRKPEWKQSKYKNLYTYTAGANLCMLVFICVFFALRR